MRDATAKPVPRLRERFITRLARLLDIDLYLGPVPEPAINPLLDLIQLEDNKETAYVWIVRDERDPKDLGEYITRLYVEHLGRGPRAMHLCLHEITDIHKFSREEISAMIKPWLMDEV